MAGSDFTGANLDHGNFGGADLRGCNFKSAILYHVNFENALVDGANFLEASIKMCRKLKLTGEQLAQLEQQKNEQREASARDLEARKSSPEYEVKKLERILLKPWVESVDDQRENGGAIVVKLKEGYEFRSKPTSNVQSFDSADSVHAGTVRSAISTLTSGNL